LYLIKQGNEVLKAVGQGLLAFAPLHMETLSVLGIAEMFLVGGECADLCNTDTPRRVAKSLVVHDRGGLKINL